MRRPPDANSPQILFSRPAYEWINRVAQKHKEFAAARLSPQQREAINQWVEVEFACSALRLDGAPLQRDQIARVVAASALDDQSQERDRSIREALAALRAVESAAESPGRQAALTPDLLLRLRDPLGGANQPVITEANLARIRSAVEWFTVDSFAELNPVEQAALVLLRLVELNLFSEATHRTALAAASLFSLRSTLPPLIVGEDQVNEYRAAIEEGQRMNTRPMVELTAQSLETTLSRMIDMARSR